MAIVRQRKRKLKVIHPTKSEIGVIIRTMSQNLTLPEDEDFIFSYHLLSPHRNKEVVVKFAELFKKYRLRGKYPYKVTASRFLKDFDKAMNIDPDIYRAVLFGTYSDFRKIVGEIVQHLAREHGLRIIDPKALEEVSDILSQVYWDIIEKRVEKIKKLPLINKLLEDLRKNKKLMELVEFALNPYLPNLRNLLSLNGVKEPGKGLNLKKQEYVAIRKLDENSDSYELLMMGKTLMPLRDFLRIYNNPEPLTMFELINRAKKIGDDYVFGPYRYSKRFIDSLWNKYDAFYVLPTGEVGVRVGDWVIVFNGY